MNRTLMGAITLVVATQLAPAQKPARRTAGPKPFYESPVMTSQSSPRLVEVEAKLEPGIKFLYLAVSDQGNRSCDWANWIAPRFVLLDGQEISLTELTWSEFNAAVGQPRVNANYKDQPLTVDGTVHQVGIGMHAPVWVRYQVPGGTKLFRAKVGIDDGGMKRNGKPSSAEVRFQLFAEKPVQEKVAADTPLQEFFNPKSRDPQWVPVEAFDVPPDLEITVWATTPLLFNPTNMDTDKDGRIWVAEGVNYRRHLGRRVAGDRIVVLEDTDGDGKADRSETFVQDPELIAPLGLAVLGNQVVVSQPPHLIVYTDVDGNRRFDPKVDTRENLLTGFFGRNHDHSLHAVVAGPDGQWYFNHGNTGADFTTRDGVRYRVGGAYQEGIKIAGARSDDGRIWTGGFAARMNPDGTGLTMIGHGFRNAYEHCVTSYGDVFQSDNDDPPACRNTWLMEGGFLGFFSRDGKRTWKADRRPGQSVAVAEWRQEDPGTQPAGDVYGPGSPTGVGFYENGALPTKYRGLYLAAEARSQVIFGYYPDLEGAGMKMERFDFIRATKGNLFRPSDVMVGADGAIYVADWFDPRVGGHADRDDSLSGTIYRIAPKGFKPKIPRWKAGSLSDAAALLASPAPNVRYEGFVALRDAGEEALPFVERLLLVSEPYINARAVWLLPFLGAKGQGACRARLLHKEPEQRILAFRALRNAGEDILAMGKRLTQDPDPAVRRELAVALRNISGEKKQDLVVALFERYDGVDRTYLEACGLAAEGCEEDVWGRLHDNLEKKDPLTWPETFARITWRLQPKAAVEKLLIRAGSEQLGQTHRSFAIDTLAFTARPEAAAAMMELAESHSVVSALAIPWLLRQANGEWQEFGVMERLKELGIYDPEKVTPQEITVPAWNGKSNLPPIKDILALEGNAERGRVVANRCIMCHTIDEQGVDYGPDLKGWVRAQGVGAFLQAVIEPSLAIAQGYDGSAINLNKGGTIHGLILSQGNPVIVQSTGGITQMIPGKMVAKVKPLKRSLMLSADQLGMTAQHLADLTEFLKGYP